MLDASLNGHAKRRRFISKLFNLLAMIFLGLCAVALYCGFSCRGDFAVYKNSSTGEKAIFPKGGGAPEPGWYLEKGDLCCEEAQALAGKPGECCQKYQVYEDARTGERYVSSSTVRKTKPEIRLLQESLCCKEAEELAGKPGACSGGGYSYP